MGKAVDNNKDRKASHAAAVSAKNQDRAAKAQFKKEKLRVHKAASASDLERMSGQLRLQGLCVREMAGDGNCFFRSLGDQLHGKPDMHIQLREEVMDYIFANRDRFQWFIEDDEEFGDYVGRMRKTGQWAGNLEVFAAACRYGVIFMIHRAGEPRYLVDGTDGHGTRMLHLAYHDGEHYNSVRSLEDPGTGAPIPIDPRPFLAKPASNDSTEGDNNNNNNKNKKKKDDYESSCKSRKENRQAARASKGNSNQNNSFMGLTGVDEEMLSRVVQTTGCFDHDLVTAAIIQANGDYGEAISIVYSRMYENAEEDIGDNANTHADENFFDGEQWQLQQVLADSKELSEARVPNIATADIATADIATADIATTTAHVSTTATSSTTAISTSTNPESDTEETFEKTSSEKSKSGGGNFKLRKKDRKRMAKAEKHAAKFKAKSEEKNNNNKDELVDGLAADVGTIVI